MDFLKKVFLILHLTSCSVPNLSEDENLKIAMLNAVEISDLNKEFMYGMMWLYTDDQNKTFSGWVKESHPDRSVKKIGYLKKGQKQGVWMEWHENGTKKSEVEWNKDYLDGSANSWYSNGILKDTGSTIKGEMNGEWKEYYSNGQLKAHSLSKMGKCVWKKVWKKDGKPCKESNLQDGNGFYFEYKDNGNSRQKRIFKKGVEIESIPANPI